MFLNLIAWRVESTCWGLVAMGLELHGGGAELQLPWKHRVGSWCSSSRERKKVGEK